MPHARWSTHTVCFNEKEMRNIVYGFAKFYTRTYGRKVTIYNDHKPLAATLQKPVADSPIRLQRMPCRSLGYHLEFKYVKGKHLLITNALSRSQATNQIRSKSEQEIDTIELVIEGQSVSSHLKEIAEEMAKDSVLQSVMHQGWTVSKRDIPAKILPFGAIKHELSFSDGISCIQRRSHRNPNRIEKDTDCKATSSTHGNRVNH